MLWKELFWLGGFLSCVPIGWTMEIRYCKRWDGIATLCCLGQKKEWRIPNSSSKTEKTSKIVTKSGVKDPFLKKYLWHHSTRWLSILICLGKQGFSRISVRRMQLFFRIGDACADVTAYSYGIFCTLLSNVWPWIPPSVSVSYVPDFDHTDKEVHLQGTGYFLLGQVIWCLGWLIWEMGREWIRYKREERKANEGRGYGWIYGHGTGTYEKHC